MSSQHHLVASPALSSSRQPRLSLLMRALHPICRHYTLSVRVHRHITGAAPHNGCIASGSSPAHQSTRNSNEGQLRLREVDHVHQSTRNGDEAVLPSVRHSHLCTRRPHFHLFRGAVHPNRRHYTPSVRVQRHVTGAAPHNGCSAGGSSPARQSIRNGDNAEVLLEYVGNYRGQPQQRSRASHRSPDAHHSYLSTSSTGDRSQGHRTTHGWLQHSWLPPHGGRQPSDSGNEYALRAFGCESRQCHITPGG